MGTRDDQNNHVYYMWNDEYGVVKIGTSKDPYRRMEELADLYPTFGNGHEYYALTEPGGYELEAARHRQFAASRIGGEFFLLSPDVRTHLDKLHADRIAAMGDTPWGEA